MYELRFVRGLSRIIDERCLKQAALAEKVGMRPETLCRILSGKRRLFADEMAAICDVIKMTVEEVMAYGEERVNAEEGV